MMSGLPSAVPGVRVYKGPKGGCYQFIGGKKQYVRCPNPREYSRKSSRVVSRRHIRGRGAFWDSAWNSIKRLSSRYVKPFEKIGGMLGNKYGIDFGGMGKEIGRMTGLGDYKYPVKKNSLLGVKTGSDATVGTMPVVNDGKKFIVTHQEFLGNISGSVGFNNLVFPINPGQKSTFPWLSNIAENFEQYILHGCVFGYKTTSSDALNSANTALGTVTMATEYNSTSAPFASKGEMLNSLYVCEGKPSLDLLHPIECAPTKNSLDVMYVRSGPSPVTQDLRFSDIGNFQIATEGQQSGTSNVVGELWVSYCCEFIKPIQNEDVSNQNAIYKLAGNLSGSDPLGTGNPVKSFDNIGLTFFNGAANNFTLPIGCEGTYQICLFWQGTSGSVTAGTLSFPDGTPATTTNAGVLPTGFTQWPEATEVSGTAVTEWMWTAYINIGEAVAPTQCNLTGFVFPGTTTYAAFTVTNLNDFVLQVESSSSVMSLSDSSDDIKELYSDSKSVMGYHFDEKMNWNHHYVPSLEVLEESLDSPNDYPEFIDYLSSQGVKHLTDRQHFDEQMVRYQRKRTIADMKAKMKSDSDHPIIVEPATPPVKDLSASQLLDLAVKKVQTKS